MRERPTFVFNPAFGIKRLRALPDGRVFAEVRPTLLVPIEDVALSPDLARFLDLPVNREEISIISSFNETNPDSFAGLLDAGGERVQNFASILDARGNISLDAFRDRVVLVIGHIEDDSFILESAGNGKSASMPLSSMAEAARNSNTTVFYLGCNSFDVSQKTGFAAKVRDLEIFAGMRRALDARSYIDLAAAFGTIDNPFILTANSMNAEVGKAILTMQRLHKNEGLVAGGSYSLRLVANIEVVEAAYWEWLRVGGFWYALGLIAGLLQVGRVWALFARAFPVLPHLDLHPGRYYAGAVLRAVIFLVVSPVAVAFALFWILLSGGWSNRESVVYATFYGIFHPRDAGVHSVGRGPLYALVRRCRDGFPGRVCVDNRVGRSVLAYNRLLARGRSAAASYRRRPNYSLHRDRAASEEPFHSVGRRALCRAGPLLRKACGADAGRDLCPRRRLIKAKPRDDGQDKLNRGVDRPKRSRGARIVEAPFSQEREPVR